MKKNNFLTKAFTLLFVALFSLTGARAATEDLTVYDGTVQNSIVPVEGSQVGSYDLIRSQFIIPQRDLSVLAKGKISSLIFYATQDVVNWYKEAKFRVYLEEVDEEVFEETGYSWNRHYEYHSWNNSSVVYGPDNLAINGNQLIITLTTPFTYSGNKNLLIGIYQTARNTSNTSTFYGQTVAGASLGSTGNDDPTQQNFIPKTTFRFTPGFIPNPVTVSTSIITRTDITGNPKEVKATLSWQNTIECDSYEVRYRTKRPIYSEDFDDGIPSDWTVWKKGEVPTSTSAFSNGWGIYRGQAASYSWYEDEGAIDADNWLISPPLELGGILKFDVSAITAWHDIYEVKIATTATIADVTDFTIPVRPLTPGIKGTQDFDLEAYKGQTGYIAIHHKNNDGHYINIDNFELSSGHTWKKLTTTDKSIQLSGLLPDLEYEYVVTGIKSGLRGETENLSFTTPHVDDIILPDDQDNEDLIYDVAKVAKDKSIKYNAFLEKRSFVDNEIWNTLSLPFDVTVTGSPFEGALIYSVKDRSSVDNTGLLTLRIDPLDNTATLKAGTPYLITWEGAKGLYEPMFSQVTFKNETHDVIGSVAGGTTIAFKPNFNLLQYKAENKSILFLNNNNLYHVGVNSRIKPQRGYFEVSGGNGVRGLSFEICEDDADGINDVNANLNGSENIYNVAGQRLGKMQKGINIVNGKKIIIK